MASNNNWTDRFGSDIQFNREETFAYIQAFYKGKGIEINVYNGIILTVEDKDAAYLVEDFEPIFDEIMDSKKLCSYDCRSRLSNASYPTVEWSLHPYDRLRELIHRYNCTYFVYMSNFNDYYTSSLIKELGANLFTPEGYIVMFDVAKDDFDLQHYTIKQIENSGYKYDDIYSWIESSRKKLSLSKKYQ